MKILQIAYHRNGVCGAPFHAVLFTEGRGKDKSRKMATVFEERGAVAVLDVDLLNANNVKFGENSWRGDNYEDWLRQEIKAWTIEKYGPEPK